MEKSEIPELKTISQQSCIFILNFYQNLTREEIIQKEKHYVQKIEYLTTMHC